MQIIPNFYSSKANVEFTIVCFDRVNMNSDWLSLTGIGVKLEVTSTTANRKDETGPGLPCVSYSP